MGPGILRLVHVALEKMAIDGHSNCDYVMDIKAGGSLIQTAITVIFILLSVCIQWVRGGATHRQPSSQRSSSRAADSASGARETWI